MSSEEISASPPRYGRIARLQGYLPLNAEDANPMVTHGQGALSQLIKSRSSVSLHAGTRRPSSVRGRETPDEEMGLGRRVRRNSNDDSEDFRRSLTDERRLSVILNGPQMRSQRLIGNSNPRYQWEKYWKTEEELKTMKKALYELPSRYHTTSLADIY
jgi:hypothetical protein